MTTQNEAFEKWIKDNHIILPIHSTNPILWAWQDATAEANKRIAELKSATRVLNELRQNSIKYATQMQASNNTLRGALKFYSTLDWKVNTEAWQLPAKQALSATPAESLAQHDNEVIEKCAKVCDEYLNSDYPECASDIQDEIRALKEVK